MVVLSFVGLLVMNVAVTMVMVYAHEGHSINDAFNTVPYRSENQREVLKLYFLD